MKRERLQALTGLAALLRDRRLEDLRRAADACAQTRARLADLAVVPEGDDLPPVAAALAAVAYQRWADRKRTELNMQLARQTADWMACQQEARLAFGKAEVLDQLARRVRRPKP